MSHQTFINIATGAIFLLCLGMLLWRDFGKKHLMKFVEWWPMGRHVPTPPPAAIDYTLPLLNALAQEALNGDLPTPRDVLNAVAQDALFTFRWDYLGNDTSLYWAVDAYLRKKDGLRGIDRHTLLRIIHPMLQEAPTENGGTGVPPQITEERNEEGLVTVFTTPDGTRYGGAELIMTEAQRRLMAGITQRPRANIGTDPVPIENKDGEVVAFGTTSGEQPTTSNEEPKKRKRKLKLLQKDNE